MSLASSPLPPLTRSPFPQRGRLISGSCFAVAGFGGSLNLIASLPSLSLWDISLPRERLFLICTLCLCLLFPRGTAFSWAPALQSLGWWGLLFLPYISGRTKKSHLERGGIFDIRFQYLHTAIHLGNCSGNYLVNATPTYWPAPLVRPVTLKPRPSPTKRTGT